MLREPCCHHEMLDREERFALKCTNDRCRPWRVKELETKSRMQYKKRVLVMKRAREASGEDDSGSGRSSPVPSTIVIEHEERNQCHSGSSPCTSDSDDGEGEEEVRTSPPSSSTSSACSGIYYNNSALRFPLEPSSSRKALPAVIRLLPPLHHHVPNGRPLPCPPKLVITRSSVGHGFSTSTSNSNSTIAALMNAAISSSHCDYRKLQAKSVPLGTTSSNASPTTKTVSPVLAPVNAPAKKVVERLGPPKKRAKRTVSFLLRSEHEGLRPDAAGHPSGRGTEDLSEDQRLFVEAAATLRRSGRQAQAQQQISPPPMARAVPPPEVTATASPLAKPGTLKRALPPPPSTLQILATSRLV